MSVLVCVKTALKKEYNLKREPSLSNPAILSSLEAAPYLLAFILTYDWANCNIHFFLKCCFLFIITVILPKMTKSQEFFPVFSACFCAFYAQKYIPPHEKLPVCT
jgi:uncharacterized membrane protein YjjP (DUF1212 family)